MTVYIQPDVYHYRHFNLIEQVQHKANKFDWTPYKIRMETTSRFLEKR